ncbi:stage V sporulation protein B [Alicyclobacillus contaminans]|uniref:stage V sporulation protein B n=1 Tax=Alicyclobacillus contaminans TaxID=392016 RepID=UPI00047A07B4|nr:stage V sporulation protein B [Alicyclobacillus contaminans]GMA51941.1 stage V sporulation protein B [Alicyclobacillus contaminans]
MNRSFLHGAMVLMAAMLVTRVMGFAYRIVLTRMIGAGGMGLFQMVFPLLGFVMTFVTAGLPIAISKLVAEAYAQRDAVRIRRVLGVSCAVILTMAAVFTALMWLLRGFVRHHWLTDPNAYPTYLAMIPVVSIIAVSSIFRGYFQGLQDMSPPAAASIAEQSVRILSVWVLAAYFVHVSLAFAAAAAMAGMVLGELSGLVWLAVQYLRRGRLSVILPDARPRSLENRRQTLRALIEVAAPVTLSRLIWSVIYALEPVLVTRALLISGVSTTMATTLYGQYGGMAIPLLVFPTVFTSSLATNLVPSVSEAMARGNWRQVQRRVGQSWTATALVGFPTSVILWLYAEPLCRAVFADQGVGPILAIMAPVGFLLYLQSPLGGVLQGLNRAGIAMRNSVIGGVSRLVLIYVLAADPRLGIRGVAWALTCSVGLTALLHLWSLHRLVGLRFDTVDTVKILLATVAMTVFAGCLTPPHEHMPGPQLLLAVTSSLLVYFILLCMMRVVTTRRVRRIPRVGRWLSMLVRAVPFSL